MPDLVVKRHAAKLAPAVDWRIVVEGGGLDMFARGEIELGLDRARIRSAQPVENPLIGRSFAWRSDRGRNNPRRPPSRCADRRECSRRRSWCGPRRRWRRRRRDAQRGNANGTAGIGQINPHIVSQHEQVLAFLAGAQKLDVSFLRSLLRDLVELSSSALPDS